MNDLILMQGVNPEACSNIEIHEMPEDMFKHVRTYMEFKACFDNAYRATEILKHRYNDVCYVLGLATEIMTPHAWIQVDGKMYDPTYQKFTDLNTPYKEVLRFDREALLLYVLNYDYPPMIPDLIRHEISTFQNIVGREFQQQMLDRLNALEKA